MFPEVTELSRNTQWLACPCSFPEASFKRPPPSKAEQWPNQTMLISLRHISKYKMTTHAQMKSDSKEEFTKQKQI